MSLHYLDPEREPRECPCPCHQPRYAADVQGVCANCKGIGRLGVKGAEPDVEIIPTSYGGYFWRIGGLESQSPCIYGGPTPESALEAARKAHTASARS